MLFVVACNYNRLHCFSALNCLLSCIRYINADLVKQLADVSTRLDRQQHIGVEPAAVKAPAMSGSPDQSVREDGGDAGGDASGCTSGVHSGRFDPVAPPAQSQRLEGHNATVHQTIAVPESGVIATGCTDGHLRIFSPDGQGAPLHDIVVDSEETAPFALRPNLRGLTSLGGDVIATGGDNGGRICTWIASSGQLLDSVTLPLTDCNTSPRIRTLAAVKSRGLLLAGTCNEDLVFISHREGRNLRLLFIERSKCDCIFRICSYGDVIAVVGGGDSMSIFSAVTCKLTAVVKKLCQSRHISALAFSDRFIVTKAHYEEMRVMSNTEGFPSVTVSRGTKARHGTVGYALLVGSDLLLYSEGTVINEDSCTLLFRSLPYGDPLAQVEVKIGFIRAIAVAADGRIAIAGDAERALIITPPAAVAATIKEEAAFLFGRDGLDSSANHALPAALDALTLSESRVRGIGKSTDDFDDAPSGVNSGRFELVAPPARSQKLEEHSEKVNRILVVPESRVVVTACADGRVRVFSPDGEALHEMEADTVTEEEFEIGYRPNLRGLASLGDDVIATGGDSNGVVSTWVASSGQFLESLELPLTDWNCSPGIRALAAAASRDDLLLAGNCNEELVFISHCEGRNLQVLSFEPSCCEVILHICTNGNVIAAVGTGGGMSIFNATTCKISAVLPDHTGANNYISALALNKHYIATKAHFEELRVVKNGPDFPDVEVPHLPEAHLGVGYVALVGDDLILSSQRLDRCMDRSTLLFRALPDGLPLAQVEINIGFIRAIAVTADGRLACGGDGEKALIVWPPTVVAAAIKKEAALLFGRYGTKSLLQFLRLRSLGMRTQKLN